MLMILLLMISCETFGGRFCRFPSQLDDFHNPEPQGFVAERFVRERSQNGWVWVAGLSPWLRWFWFSGWGVGDLDNK